MKKVLSLVLVLVLVLGSFPVFADVTDYGAELKTLGLLSGDENGNLNPDQPLDRASMMVVLATYYGELAEAQDFPLNSTFTDVDPAAWYAPVVAYAQVEGWTAGYGDGTFGPADAVTEQMAAAYMLRALGYADAWATAVEDAEALGIATDASAGFLRANLFELMYETLNTETTDGVLLGTALGVEGFAPAAAAIESVTVVDTNKIEVKFDGAVDTDAATVKLMKGLAVYNVTVTWNEAADTATLEYVIDFASNDYTVVVEGLTDEALTAAVTVEDEEAVSIEVISNTIDLATAAGAVVGHVNVYNQYGTLFEAVATDLTVTAYSALADLTLANADIVANVDDDDDYLLDIEVDVTLAADFEVVAGDTFRMTVVYEDFVGVANPVFADVAEMVDFSFGTPYVTAINGDVLEDDDDQPARIYAGDSVAVPYTAFDQYGAAIDLDTVTFVSNDGDILDAATIVVNTDDDLLEFDVADSGTLVVTAIFDEYGVVEQFAVTIAADGELTTASLAAPTVLIAATEEVELAAVGYNQYGDEIDLAIGDFTALAAADGAIAFDAETGLLTYTAPAEAVEDVTVEIVDGDGDAIASVTFDVEEAAVANAVSKVTFNALFEIGATDDMDVVDDLVVLDQYGREFEGTDVVITEKDADNDNFTFNADGTGFVAVTAGSKTFTVEVDGEVSAVKDFTLTAIDSDDIVSYAVEDIDPIYAGGGEGYEAAVVLVGQTASGATVVLGDTMIDNLTSTSSVVDLDDTLLEIEGNASADEDTTVTVKAWAGATLLDTFTVEVLVADPVETAISFTEDVQTEIDVEADGYDAYVVVGAELEILDQYGVDITADVLAAMTLVWSSSDEDVVAADGEILAEGEVTIGVVTENGLVTTVDIEVTNFVPAP